MGEGMDIRIFMVLASFLIIIIFGVWIGLAFFWGRKWALQEGRGKEPQARVESPPAAERETGGEFLAALEAAHKRLEAVLARAEMAEQKLNRTPAPPETAKPDSYATAAFLLANGEEVDRVARRLNLSTSQVRLVQQLRRELDEKPDDGTEEREERLARLQRRSGENNGIGYGENFAVRQNGTQFLAK